MTESGPADGFAGENTLPPRLRAALEADERLRGLLTGTGGAPPGRSGTPWYEPLLARLAGDGTLRRSDLLAALRIGMDLRRIRYEEAAGHRLVDRVLAALAGEPEPARADVGRWLRYHLRASLAGARGGPISALVPEAPAAALAERPPAFPSTLAALDEGPTGGFYGVTCLAGEAGVGKSLLALAAAVEAARAGWTVVYYDGELDKRAMLYRLQRRLGVPLDALAAACPTFHALAVDAGAGLDDFVRWTAAHVGATTDRVLVVLDSLNSLARMAWIEDAATGGGDRSGYFTALSRLLVWSVRTRRRTGGLVSALLVSEVNASGGEYGREIRYLADLVVRIEALDATGETVEVTSPKGREGGRGDLGRYTVDWRRVRFVPLGESIADGQIAGGQVEEKEPAW